MAGQGLLFRLSSCLGTAKSLLSVNRSILVTHGQTANMKKLAAERLRELNVPAKPKKPLSAYFRFMLDQRTELARKHPGLKVIDISRRCAELWASANQSVKQKYDAQVLADTEEYQQQYQEYKSGLTDEQKEALKSVQEEKVISRMKRVMRKRNKDANKPKRPPSAFLFYLQDVARRENKNINIVIKSIKGQYQALPEAEKNKYRAMHQEDKERYDVEMAAWERRMLDEGKGDLVRVTTVANPRPATVRPRPSRLAAIRPPRE